MRPAELAPSTSDLRYVAVIRMPFFEVDRLRETTSWLDCRNRPGADIGSANEKIQASLPLREAERRPALPLPLCMLRLPEGIPQAHARPSSCLSSVRESYGDAQS